MVRTAVRLGAGCQGTDCRTCNPSAALDGAGLLTVFSKTPETQVVKQNLWISTGWKSVTTFKNTERTKETPLEPWAARGHPCSPGGVWPS